ncbi:hypothetical protein [Hathewaya limosa]|uniref:Uncharacterized protein n=1 Tax=Hathewaya limosa TaxID=1536 RepID=A0ABU0JQM9_HATLI|nr:hypothetical protein [Hathewaya limosa]AWZ48089.1 hypothetical protein C3495_04345 [Clostridiaceae bacterium 14S0207]MDQ0479402.1 hypothetical protein [Hathewaya limosa]
MIKSIDNIGKIYNKNIITGNYIIEVALDKYIDAFNDLDYCSYQKRDMNPKLMYFLENSVQDISNKYGIDICFYMFKENKDKKYEDNIKVGIKTYYYFLFNEHVKEVKDTYKRVVIYCLSSFFILLIQMFLGTIIKSTVLFNTIVECLNIGGWVFLWEALTLIFINRKSLMYNDQNYKRLMESTIYFRYI